MQAQNDLTTAINARNKARAQHKLTEINEARQRDLFNARAAAKRDYEQAQADFAAAVNDLKTAEIGIDTVRKRLRILGKSDREIEALTTDGAQINPEAVVQAPISGTVIARKVSPDNTSRAAQAIPSSPSAIFPPFGLLRVCAKPTFPASASGRPSRCGCSRCLTSRSKRKSFT